VLEAANGLADCGAAVAGTVIAAIETAMSSLPIHLRWFIDDPSAPELRGKLLPPDKSNRNGPYAVNAVSKRCLTLT
jgi:hypothetical protein